jgi:ribosomal protein S6--L-glutamate ligase
MNIALLTMNKNLYSSKRFLEAAKSRGHKIRAIDYSRCYMTISGMDDGQKIFYKGTDLKDIDVIIPRIGASHNLYGTSIIRQFELMGKFSLNSSLAIKKARDKLRSLQILSKKGMPMPLTGIADSTQDIDGLINCVGGAPLVVKLLEGTQGLGVVLAETRKAATSVIEALRGLDAYFIVQEFIHEAQGCDIRCFVVGDKVVASMQRTAPPGEFRANIHRGAKGSSVVITNEERALSIKVAKAMRLNIAGVDIIRSSRGPLILEVNSTPGLEGIEKATKVDVAGHIIKFIEKNWRREKMSGEF